MRKLLLLMTLLAAPAVVMAEKMSHAQQWGVATATVFAMGEVCQIPLSKLEAIVQARYQAGQKAKLLSFKDYDTDFKQGYLYRDLLRKTHHMVHRKPPSTCPTFLRNLQRLNTIADWKPL